MMHLRLVLRGILWAICGDRCYLEWETWTEFRLYYTHSILCFILIDASDFPVARHQRDVPPEVPLPPFEINIVD